MLNPDIPVSVFERLLRRAVLKFHAELIADPYLSDFLKEADLDHLKTAQLATALGAVHDDDSHLFLRFKKLARLHFERGVPYVEYHDAFDRLHTILHESVGMIAAHKGMQEAADTFIKNAINAGAAGYLESMLENDSKTLRRQISQQIDIPAVKEHLQWIMDVLEDIRSMNAHPVIEFNEKKCKCGSWLHSSELEKFIEDARVRKEILEIHHKIHLITQNIYRSIRRRDYHKIFIDYINLVRQSMYLYSELNLNVTQHVLIEDVSKDALTGLLNRRYLDEVLKSEIRLHALTGGAFSIVMFDLDRFKEINDTCGHQAGDTVLVTFARLLKKHVRKTDNIFRYGGEEFLAVLRGTSAEEAYGLCEKIRADFEKRVWHGCLKTISVTVSIGIAQYSNALKESPRRVIYEADRNLYRAKRLGRNRTVL
jgi:diguanylate cyclase (GGDEF)-like protein